MIRLEINFSLKTPGAIYIDVDHLSIPLGVVISLLIWTYYFHLTYVYLVLELWHYSIWSFDFIMTCGSIGRWPCGHNWSRVDRKGWTPVTRMSDYPRDCWKCECLHKHYFHVNTCVIFGNLIMKNFSIVTAGKLFEDIFSSNFVI